MVVLLDYALVLVVVTFNLGLVLSATLGFCLGALAFGEARELAHGGAGASIGWLAPGSLRCTPLGCRTRWRARCGRGRIRFVGGWRRAAAAGAALQPAGDPGARR